MSSTFHCSCMTISSSSRFFEEIYFQPIYTDYEYFYDEKMTLKYLQKSELWLLYF